MSWLGGALTTCPTGIQTWAGAETEDWLTGYGSESSGSSKQALSGPRMRRMSPRGVGTGVAGSSQTPLHLHQTCPDPLLISCNKYIAKVSKR